MGTKIIITREEYNEALNIVEAYHSQLNVVINNIKSLEPKKSKYVKCLHTYAGGHNLHMLTIGKPYEIIHNPRTRGVRAEFHNKREFAIIDDNGEKRFYPYKNPSSIWEFI